MKRGLVLGFVFLLIFGLAACGSDSKNDVGKKTFTIGVLNHSEILQVVFEGFKTGMEEHGYNEGETVFYIYDGPTGSIEGLEPVAETLKNNKEVDLIVTLGTPPTTLAKTTFTGVPVLFAPANDPVGAGLVESISSPGGNLTGVQGSISTARALQWLVDIAPGIKTVCVPHNPNDGSSVADVQTLQETAATLGIELILVEVTTPDEVLALAQNLPEEADSIFLVRAGLINSRYEAFVTGAIARGIPIATATIGAQIDNGLLIGYGQDYFEVGKQAARIADQILKHGASPASLPVETAASFLGLNLKTADTIGLTIPDSVLRQATQIVRVD